MAREEKMCNNNNNNSNNNNSSENSVVDLNEDPTDFHSAQIMINALRLKCRSHTEKIMTWKKAFTNQEEQHFRQQKHKNEQLNAVTSQLLLLQSRLMRKQKQISQILGQRDLTILRQQKIIDALTTRLIDNGIDANDTNGYNDFDSLNDSDSAVVLEDIDSDCNSTLITRRKPGSSDVTIIRSISDAIETNLKYSNVRRSNCFLRRPDILETVYSVEEDPEPGSNDINEKRDKFKHRTEKIVDDHNSIQENEDDDDLINWSSKLPKLERDINKYNYNNYNYNHTISNNHNNIINNKQAQVTNYNRVMSNHRSVTKPKDVKYKRINKAKSKSLEELRGKLRHWVEKGTTNYDKNLSSSPTSSSPTTTNQSTSSSPITTTTTTTSSLLSITENNKKTMMTNCYT